MEARTKDQPSGSPPTGHGPWITSALSPLVWMAQGACAWYIVGRACPARHEPFSLSVCRGLIGALTLAALGVTLVGLTRARRALREDRRPRAAGNVDAVLAAEQQRRFVAQLGMVAAVVLTFGLVLACLASFIIQACGEAR